MNKYLFAALQYLLPHHPLSRLMGRVMACQQPWVKNQLITRIVRAYGVNMSEAQQPEPTAYPSFNAFFTRPLRPEVRPVAPGDDTLLCPADGAISQAGPITEGRLFQAKGRDFGLVDLLGGDAARAEPFRDGLFATIYLSPRDYHRMHMPAAGVLKEMVLVPGRLFSVNQATAETVPGLFARNERVVAIFETAFGPMALIMVGAIFVASIETVWHGVVTPPAGKAVQTWRYAEDAPRLAKGAELGRFNMGSTIIVVLPKGSAEWATECTAGAPVQVNSRLGRALSGRA